MYPVFEINGVEYTAERMFGRFGAMIRCRMTHPAGLLLYFTAVSGDLILEHSWGSV